MNCIQILILFALLFLLSALVLGGCLYSFARADDRAEEWLGYDPENGRSKSQLTQIP